MSRFARPAFVASIGLGAALAIAACGGTTPTSAPATSVPGGSQPAGSAAAGVISVEAKEYSFTPSAITVPAGDVTFQVKNAGTEEHEFEIFRGDTVVDEIEGLVPGLTLDLKVPADKLPPGDYTFKCLINGHDQLGMTGTLTVTGS